MKIGIVGLPNVGKSTLFNALTSSKVEAANYPFCTIEPNVGIVPVPDERLLKLKEIYSPEKFTPAVIEFVDIAGIVKGASKGEGLGNKFLDNIAKVDAILHVVRCFENPDVTHVEGSTNPKRDIEIINFELILSDLEKVERRIEKLKKLLKSDKSAEDELSFNTRLKETLEKGLSAKSMKDLTKKESLFLSNLNLLSAKPVIYAANVSEGAFKELESNKYINAVIETASKEGSLVLPVCVKFESEIADLPDNEKEMFLNDLNLKDFALKRLIKNCYHLLNLISFLTAGKKEVKAWAITHGTKAPQAAGKIHSDFERGFIKADVISYSDLIKAENSMQKAKELGLIRSEGKEYKIKDGDIVNFKFNV